MKSKKLIAVTGPTATGKTALGMSAAHSFGGEIVSCDSMQIYKGLPIGTAQPSEDQRTEIPHHLIAFQDIAASFSVSDYVNTAEKVISDIYSRNKLPILVGGTGMYARSLLYNSSFDEDCRDDKLRDELYITAENGSEGLYQRLKELDSSAAEKIHPNNTKRLVRALEYCIITGRRFSDQQSWKAEKKYDYLMLCLCYRDRKKLYGRIEDRVDLMMDMGLLQEAESFYKLSKGCSSLPTAAQAIGYKELFPYFDGAVSLEEAVSNIKKATRRYAKRQMVWFKKESEITFIYIDDYDTSKDAETDCIRLIDEFLSGGD